MKRYRFKAQKHYAYTWLKKVMQALDGIEVEIKNKYSKNYVEVVPVGYCYPVFKALLDDLEEIKDEPMSAEEWIHEEFGTFSERSVYDLSEAIAIFNAGAAENEKKYRAKQTFEEWWRGAIHNNNYSNEQYARDIWQACLKAHNLREGE